VIAKATNASKFHRQDLFTINYKHLEFKLLKEYFEIIEDKNGMFAVNDSYSINHCRKLFERMKSVMKSLLKKI